MTLTVNGCCVDTKFPLSLIIITIGYLTLCKNFMYFILILCFWLLFDPSIYLIEEALKPFSKLIYVYQMDATWLREREILKLYWLSNILGHPIFLRLCNYLPAMKRHDMSDAKHYFLTSFLVEFFMHFIHHWMNPKKFETLQRSDLAWYKLG